VGELVKGLAVASHQRLHLAGLNVRERAPHAGDERRQHARVQRPGSRHGCTVGRGRLVVAIAILVVAACCCTAAATAPATAATATSTAAAPVAAAAAPAGLLAAAATPATALLLLLVLLLLARGRVAEAPLEQQLEE
jgi:hypothetical protein